MQENQTVTDVAFTETTREEAVALFNPVTHLTATMEAAGLTDAAAKWTLGIDPRAQSAEGEKDRIFFANRSLRLFLAEIEDRENITPRMLLADGIDSPKWIALMEQGIIPWLLNQFDKKGKRVSPEAEQVEAASDEVPPPHFANGQLNGVPLSDFPDIQEQVRKGLDDDTLQIQGNVDDASTNTEGEGVIQTGIASIDDLEASHIADQAYTTADQKEV